MNVKYILINRNYINKTKETFEKINYKLTFKNSDTNYNVKGIEYIIDLENFLMVNL